MYQAYTYCKLFHCSISEYEERPHQESAWMLKIDEAYTQAVNDANERANKG